MVLETVATTPLCSPRGWSCRGAGDREHRQLLRKQTASDPKCGFLNSLAEMQKAFSHRTRRRFQVLF